MTTTDDSQYIMTIAELAMQLKHSAKTANINVKTEFIVIQVL